MTNINLIDWRLSVPNYDVEEVTLSYNRGNERVIQKIEKGTAGVTKLFAYGDAGSDVLYVYSVPTEDGSVTVLKGSSSGYGEVSEDTATYTASTGVLEYDGNEYTRTEAGDITLTI